MQRYKESYQGIRVLVTGGAGFIGSHLVEALVALGAHVRVLDNFSSGFRENLASVVDRITIIEGSITDFETCLIATKNIDIIFHCAALVSVPASVQEPQSCHHINIMGTAHLLEAARRNSVARFVLSSSSAVYGPKSLPCVESMHCEPTSPYGFSKLIDEQLCAEYARVFNMQTLALRYFNVYGPRQNPKGPYAGIVAKFSDQMSRLEPITIFGDGSNTRDFISVFDVVHANIALGTLDAALMNGQAVNVASGNTMTIHDVVAWLRHDYPQWPGIIQYAPERSGDIYSSSADCTKLRALLDTLERPNTQPHHKTQTPSPNLSI